MKTIEGDERCRCWGNDCSFEGDDQGGDRPSVAPSKRCICGRGRPGLIESFECLKKMARALREVPHGVCESAWMQFEWEQNYQAGD